MRWIVFIRVGDSEVSVSKCLTIGILIFILSELTAFLLVNGEPYFNDWVKLSFAAYALIALVIVVYFKKFGVITKVKE